MKKLIPRTYQGYKKIESRLLEEGQYRKIYQLRRSVFILPLTRKNNKLTKVKLAEKLGCSRNTITKIEKDYNVFLNTGEVGHLTSGRPTKYSEEEWEFIEEKYLDGKTLGFISHHTNIPKSTIRDYLVKFGIYEEREENIRKDRIKKEKLRKLI